MFWRKQEAKVEWGKRLEDGQNCFDTTLETIRLAKEIGGTNLKILSDRQHVQAIFNLPDGQSMSINWDERRGHPHQIIITGTRHQVTNAMPMDWDRARQISVNDAIKIAMLRDANARAGCLFRLLGF